MSLLAGRYSILIVCAILIALVVLFLLVILLVVDTITMAGDMKRAREARKAAMASSSTGVMPSNAVVEAEDGEAEVDEDDEPEHPRAAAVVPPLPMREAQRAGQPQTAAAESRPIPTLPEEPASPRIVINSSARYEPEELDRPYQFPGKAPNPRNDARRYLILERPAFQKLHQSLDWGQRTRRNRVEQGGILLGRTSRYENEIYCFVEDILLADTRGDPVFVEFTPEMWSEMQTGLSELNEARAGQEPLVIVGWFHTHPNGLSVFMSGTDMATQRLNFGNDWQASLVMNPHTNKYRAFFGANAAEGKVVLPS